MRHNYKGVTYNLRESRSKSMPGYIYHVLEICGVSSEVPCFSDGHNIAQSIIDGEMSLIHLIPYSNADECETYETLGETNEFEAKKFW